VSRKDKLVNKLLNLNGSLTYQELATLLRLLGYSEIKTGKTAGSRRAFFNDYTKHLIRLHQPHPGNELKRYQKIYIIDELKKEKVI